MADTQTRINPLIAVAAISVIVFSAVGIGVMTGVIPSSFSRTAEHAPAGSNAVVAKTDSKPQAAAPTETRKTSAAQQPKREAAKPAQVAAAEPARPAQVAAAEPPKPAVCGNCGRVEAVEVFEQKGEGTGLGAVAGGVVGGVLGNQIGGGTGRKLATVAGVAGGAYAGHEIEKRAKATKHYEVAVRMDDGTLRRFPYDAEPPYRTGDRIKVVNGQLVSG